MQKMSKRYQGLDIDWSPQRSTEALQGLHRKQAAQGRLRIGIGAAVLVVMSLGAYHSLDVEPKTRSSKVASVANSQKLKSGSTVLAMSTDTQFTVVGDTVASTEVRLLQGEIEVRRASLGQRNTKLILLSDAYRIEVHAPSVWASHSSRETKLSIEQGFLEITAQSMNKRLEARQSIALAHATPLPVELALEFPAVQSGENARAIAPHLASKPPKKALTRRNLPSKKMHPWRDLANKGDFEQAYQELHKAGIQSVLNRVDDLMLAADIARGTGHARQALQPLTRILKNFASDSQAPLAAFTLGRIQLEDLKRPLAAAKAFETSYKLNPTGPLAQDALAREVEALAKSGKSERATERARTYLSKYPRGHRVRSVKQHANL